MNLRPRLVYLDNNAIGSLFEVRQLRTAELLQHRRAMLVHRVRRGAVVVMVSLYALEEFGPVFRVDESRYRSTLSFLRHGVKATLMAPTDQLVSREIERRRMLRGDELLLAPRECEWAWNRVMSGQGIDAVAKLTTRRKIDYQANARKFVADMDLTLQGMLGPIENRTGREPTLAQLAARLPRKDLERWIDEYASRALPEVLRARNVPPGSGITHPMIPTARHVAAFNVGRRVRNALGRRVNPSDAHDHNHYASARYADLLVTDDKEFRETVALIEPSFPTSTFDRFFQSACGPVVSFDDGRRPTDQTSSVAQPTSMRPLDLAAIPARR